MGQFIIMPKLGLTMTEGKIIKWHKKEGDSVNKGDEIFTVETSKLSNTVEATISGVIRKIIHRDGIVQVLKPVGIIANENEDISEILLQIEQSKELESTEIQKSDKKIQNKQKANYINKKVKATPKAKKMAIDFGIDLQQVIGTGPSESITTQDILKYKESSKKKVKSSPVADIIADTLDIDLSKMNIKSRIMKSDVIEYWNCEQFKEMANPEEKRNEMSTMRKVISQRMSESQMISATVNYNLSVDTTEMKILKEKVKVFYKITYTDIIVKILSKTLLEFPLLNSSIEEDEIITRNYVNMGVAVALDEGLIVPVVKYANVKGIQTISKEIKILAEKARMNTLELEEISGSTFTVTNMGMFNMESFTPIINQPEVAILGINTIKDIATLVNGELVFKPMMTLSLTADHRIVDGSLAARFLNRVKEYMENPSILML